MGQVYLSQQMADVLANAHKKAKEFKDDFISTEHLLLALLTNKPIAQLLAQYDVTEESVMRALKDIGQGRSALILRNQRHAIKPSKNMARTSQKRHGSVNWIPLLGETPRSAASCRFFRAAQRIIRFSLEKRVWEKRLSWKGSRNVLQAGGVAGASEEQIYFHVGCWGACGRHQVPWRI